MPGAYVALPAASVASGLPPGWSLLWPFPGPFPPGYESELSLTLAAQAAMVPGASVTGVDLNLYDQSTYATAEPPEQIMYSAKLLSDDSTVNLKFDGGSTFLPSVSKAYLSMGGDFWGDTPDFEFDVDANDIGDSIVLTATSSPLSQDEITQTDNILIVAEFTWTAVLTHKFNEGTSGNVNYYTRTFVAADSGASVTQRAWAASYYYYSPSPAWSYGNQADGDTTVTNPDGAADEATITIDAFLNDTYKVISGYLVSRPDASSVDLTLEMYRNGELQTTTTKTQSQPAYGPSSRVDEDWLTINGETGEVTVINP